jgi:hypothetical protein
MVIISLGRRVSLAIYPARLVGYYTYRFITGTGTSVSLLFARPIERTDCKRSTHRTIVVDDRTGTKSRRDVYQYSHRSLKFGLL